MISKHAALAVLAAIAASAPTRAAVTISTAATQNMSCSGGVCAPTATDAVLNVTNLENLLATGNTTVTTTGSGVQATSINVNAAFSWNSSSTLGLDAYRSVSINRDILVDGVAGLTMTTNDGGTGGTLFFARNGHVDFASTSSQLSINGSSFALEDTLPALAGAITENPGGDYALTNDYNASQDGYYSESPVSSTLNGTFEGLGHRISRLEVAYHTAGVLLTGLFSEIGSSGIVRDIGLSDVDLRLNYGYEAHFGALVGENLGQVLNSFAEGTIDAGGSADAGGLIAFNSGTVAGSYANVAVSATDYEIVGGLVASNSGTISTSFATGDVSAGTNSVYTGGLVGFFESGKITDCYATGNVTAGRDAIGGLIGYISAEFGYPMSRTSYSTGAVPSDDKKHGVNAGGSIGQNNENKVYDQVYWDYWDTTTSGTDVGVGRGSKKGVSPLTTQQLQGGLPPGFSPNTWAEQPSVNNGFPYLIANPPVNRHAILTP